MSRLDKKMHQLAFPLPYVLKRELGDLQRGVIHTTLTALESRRGGQLRSQSANKNHLSTRSTQMDPSPLYKWALFKQKNTSPNLNHYSQLLSKQGPSIWKSGGSKKRVCDILSIIFFMKNIFLIYIHILLEPNLIN